MKKTITLLAAITLISSASCARGQKQASGNPEQEATATTDSLPTVYFTREITPESLLSIYKALGVEPTGNVAIKISTGESEQTGYLRPEFIKPLVDATSGTIVECNTAYPGT